MRDEKPINIKNDDKATNEEMCEMKLNYVYNYILKAHKILSKICTQDSKDEKLLKKCNIELINASKICENSFTINWFQKWGKIIYLVIISTVEAIFIHFYCVWHGAKLLSLELYSPENINILKNIGFVGVTLNQNGVLSPAPTMSIAAEVLMWSSIGFWAHRSYTLITRYKGKILNPAHDITNFAGLMIRNTSCAAIIMIILNVSKFSIFGVSIDKSFEVTAGLSFLLGFFGDITYTILSYYRDKFLSYFKRDENEE